MRVGVIGYGSIGARHARNLTALGCVVPVMDVSESARARATAEHPAGLVSDRMSFDGLDALVIATPYDSHLCWVEEAIRRRLPFFVEKPLGSLEQLPRWREIAAMDLPVNQVGYNWRWHPQLLEWKSRYDRWGRAEGGGVGIECATDLALWPGSAYGDPVLECSHEIDTALWLGASATVNRAAYLYEEPGCSITMGHAWITWRWARAEAFRKLRFNQPCRDFLVNKFCHCPTHERLGLTMYTPSVMLDLSYRREMQHFLECVTQQKPSLTPVVDGLRVLEVVQRVLALCEQAA